MYIKYVHTNLISKDWRNLARFYVEVFGCKYKYPERGLEGDWLDSLTSINNVQIQGIHLVLPGYDESGPTLEIFQYNSNEENANKKINTEGYGHIAFSVDDVDECLNRIIANGGSAVGETVNGEVSGVGKIHLVYAKDPEGNIIEIQTWE